jgi:hypothetical protein
MDTYRFVCLRPEGGSVERAFTAASDDDAIACGLRARTADPCQLYRSDFLLATFDGCKPVVEARVVVELAC